MGGGGRPAETFKALCTFVGENSATFSSNGLSVSIAGKKEIVEYFEKNKTYVFDVSEAPAD
jgi:hypothetical protein